LAPPGAAGAGTEHGTVLTRRAAVTRSGHDEQEPPPQEGGVKAEGHACARPDAAEGRAGQAARVHQPRLHPPQVAGRQRPDRRAQAEARHGEEPQDQRQRPQRQARVPQRQQQPAPVGRAVAADSAYLPEALTREPTPLEAVVLDETVEQLLAGLDEDERAIVELSLQGHTTREVSEQLDVTERTVWRVRERVRHRLERAQGEGS